MLLDKQTLIESLNSTLCPACGGEKIHKQSFCFSCYRRLPKAKKNALFQFVGDGYEEAFDAALDHLHVSDPFMAIAEQHG